MLVSDLITQSFLDMGAIAPGETITTLEQTDAFLRLNQMIKSWSTEQLTVPNMTHGSFSLTGGTNVYTLGTGGSLVTSARPIRVTGASSTSGNFRQGMKVMSWEQFAMEVSDPIASASVLAEVLAADGAFPSINLKVFPMPGAGAGLLNLDYWSAVAAFAAVGDAINLPEGWEHALHFNLAAILYPQYGRMGYDPTILLGLAQASKGSLVALNQQILGMSPAAAA